MTRHSYRAIVAPVALLFILMSLVASCTKSETPAPPAAQTASFVDVVANGESDIFSIPFDSYRDELDSYPIGVFDSGIGGLTVLEAILTVDNFDKSTHSMGADGIPDFDGERFVYLGDQANMPYGNYPAEGKTDFLKECILKDAAFLLGTRYFNSQQADMPRSDKPPVKAIVIACNTATAYGLEDIREALGQWNIPVYLVGVVEAGAKGAVADLEKRGGSGSVAVMATVGTCSSKGYVRAVDGVSRAAGMQTPVVVQQGCLGLAGAIEGDATYITKSGDNPGYRGPAVGNEAVPIDPKLADRYAFQPEGLIGDTNDPATWKINSVENYIRYHTATLTEHLAEAGIGSPVTTVILGCTHFPFHAGSITGSFARLRDYTAPDGSRPYRDYLAENLTFIDPAVLTAADLYAALAGRDQLLADGDTRLIDVDEFYISVPNPATPGAQLAEGGGFTYEYKYGREPGDFTVEYVRRVPMSVRNLTAETLGSIRSTMPAVWERLVLFNEDSPRTAGLPETDRIK